MYSADREAGCPSRKTEGYCLGVDRASERVRGVSLEGVALSGPSLGLDAHVRLATPVPRVESTTRAVAEQLQHANSAAHAITDRARYPEAKD